MMWTCNSYANELANENKGDLAMSMFLNLGEVKVAQSRPTLCFATPQTIQSMEFSRPEYWSG